MKNLLLLACMVMTFNLYGQRKSKKVAHFLKIQNGFLYDSHFNVDYTGFNLIRALVPG